MAAPAQLQLFRQVSNAWQEASLEVSIDPAENGRMHALTPEPGRAFEVALRTLNAAGCRTCWDRHRGAVTVFAFSENGALCLRIGDRSDLRPSRRRRWNGAVSPTVALLGPDGVGKSTALRLAREWFEREAPFVDVTVRQWRPALIPSLASVLGKPEDLSGSTRPRRTPGKLHWLRLFYYYWDFLLGSWWKDRTRGDGSRLIVYDRCALDMWVDPYRFALKSRRGTWTLWRWTPRPQKLVLLYDTAERIAKRKDDLEEHEVAEQLVTWLDLAARDEVHAVIRVNAGPEEIARRIRDLFIDTFVRHHEHRPASAPSQIPYAAAPGSHASSKYAVVPSLANPRFLLPLDSRTAAVSSLAVYNAQRSVARIAREILGMGLRTGVAQPLLHRIAVADQPLRDFLAPLLGHNDLSIAVSLGTPGPNQKPALQIMNRAGKILAYAKIGVNAKTIASIRNEEAALVRLARNRFSNTEVPQVLGAGSIGKDYILVQSPAGDNLANVPGCEDRHVRFLAELHRIDPGQGALPCPTDTAIARAATAGLHYYAHLLERARTEYSWYRNLPLGPAHGDFTPWNIRAAGRKLVVFDWETFDARVPAGWDLFHLIVAGGVEIDDAKPGEIYAAFSEPGETRAHIENYFHAIGADPRWIEPLLISYAANSLAAGVLNLPHETSEKDRAMQRTWAALLALACNRGSAAIDQTLQRQELPEAV